MNKYIVIALIFVCAVGTLDGGLPHTQYQPQFDNVAMDWQLPQFGTLCAPADVRGGPDETIYPVMKTLPVGSTVPLHELGATDSSWVMIEPAKWIKLQNVCDW